MTPEDIAPEDIAYVTALVKKSGSSFYHGMKILPAARRDAMYAIYAFCRVVDDIADEEGRDFALKQFELNQWRSRIATLYQGHADDPITRALLSVIAHYHVLQDDFLAVIDGMEMDAGAPIIAPSLEELDLYCDRVASAVGRLSIRVFGDSSAKAAEVAYALGRGLQLTNILRDVGEDAANDANYICRANYCSRQTFQPPRMPPSPRPTCPASAANWLKWPRKILSARMRPWNSAMPRPCARPG